MINQLRGSNLNLFVFQQLKQGLNPSKISKQFNLSLSCLSYHLASLTERGLIKKVGYGTYEILKDLDDKQVQKSTHVATHQLGVSPKNLKLLKSDMVRGHGFVFRFELSKNLRNWDRRAELLERAGIQFKSLKIFGGAQQIILSGRKIWLTGKSIVIYEKESFVAELARDAHSRAISHFVGLLKALERHLRANLEIHKSRFKVTRQHYALVKNALARQYDEEGKKLECYTGDGLWFLIDNSFNLHEAETVHPKTGVSDNEKVQNFFNGIKAFDDFTPQTLINSIGQVTNNQLMFAENMKSHISAIQELSVGVKELREEVKNLGKAKDI